MNRYLFAGYTVIWTLLLLYLLYLNKKQRNLARKLESLSESLRERESRDE
jgi:CcmD family protein